MVEKISAGAFQERVLCSDVPVLVDFFQLHCLPCKRMDPVLEEAAQLVGDKGRIYCVQFEESPQLIVHYDVMSFPTMILFNDGLPVKRLIGPKPLEVITGLFDGPIPKAGVTDSPDFEL